tara:strand:- start:36 stop:191 length:156 start_codon:yes stop_codon:yes gene_type:complete
MVIAGIRNKKMLGALKNKELRFEYPMSKTLLGPLKTHMNIPVAIRNTAIVI